MVEIDPKFARPGKQVELVGDISKAREKLGFEPKVKFKELIKLLIEHKQREIDKEIKLKSNWDLWLQKYQVKYMREFSNIL